jgi:hypothetical protein
MDWRCGAVPRHVSGFEEFPDTSVGDMVLMEASLVANEAGTYR